MSSSRQFSSGIEISLGIMISRQTVNEMVARNLSGFQMTIGSDSIYVVSQNTLVTMVSGSYLLDITATGRRSDESQFSMKDDSRRIRVRNSILSSQYP
ncbi:hypothetical protein TNCT_262001 [Trichonephila clavata]|uniref:Uncharacterized protein n=1 Tax=Trichonephila clavata TaxID=2740835 RepID=A0A8X6G443_TRICU|nr:hypothetical protein TNCT_262001 [Trichonephila clavata]